MREMLRKNVARLKLWRSQRDELEVKKIEFFDRYLNFFKIFLEFTKISIQHLKGPPLVLDKNPIKFLKIPQHCHLKIHSQQSIFNFVIFLKTSRIPKQTQTQKGTQNGISFNIFLTKQVSKNHKEKFNFFSIVKNNSRWMEENVTS